jgi:tetratricopeptide (TPR) repeat protein
VNITTSIKLWTTIFALLSASSTSVIAADSSSVPQFPTDPAGQRELLKKVDDMLLQNPDDYRGYGMRASLLERLGEYDKGLADINKANDLHPRDPQILAARSILYARKKNYNLAIADCGQAILLQPNAINYANRAALYLAVNKLAEARIDAEQAMKLDSSLSTAYEAMGEVFYKSGRYHEAIQYLSAAIKRDERNGADAYFFRGRSYERLGNKIQAAADLKRSAQLGYKEGEAMFITKDR